MYKCCLRRYSCHYTFVYTGMVFDPGVRQARIDLTPTRKSDLRVKKHDLALFRLQQYNRFLHVCLCPIVTCSLLLLLYLIAEKHTQQTNSKTYSKSRTNLCTCDSPRRATPSTIKKVCANALISRRQCQKRHVRRAVTKCTIQVLLLRAGDVEPNPGPTRGMCLPTEKLKGEIPGYLPSGCPFRLRLQVWEFPEDQLAIVTRVYN